MAGVPHSKVGASTCERWWNCPGSVALIATIPPQPPSRYAEEGTAAHELAARCLVDNTDAIEHIGETSKNGIDFTDEMAEAVQVYLDRVRADLDTYHLGPQVLQVEHTFHLKSIDPDAFGTNDCCIPVFLDTVIVYDYKHGQGVAVEVENNRQLLFYALGALEHGDYEHIDMVIVQPRAPHADGRIRDWRITAPMLAVFAEQLKEHIAATKAPKAPLKCGLWCEKTFCPAMAVCPEIRKCVDQTAMTVFTEVTPATIGPPPPGSLTPAQLRRLLENVPMIETWLKAVWSYAEQKANAGETVEGFKLVKGREGNRKWADEAAAEQILAKLTPDEEAIYMEPKLKSPAQIEKLLGKANKKVVDKLSVRAEGKTILVPESDPRPEVAADVTKVFDNSEQLLIE